MMLVAVARAEPARGGISTVLMQLSYLLEKMWYASDTSSSGTRWVMISLGFRWPWRMCSIRCGTWRFTEAWFMRIVMPLFSALPIGTALKVGPYTPTIDTWPPLRTELMAQNSAVAAPACSMVQR